MAAPSVRTRRVRHVAVAVAAALLFALAAPGAAAQQRTRDVQPPPEDPPAAVSGYMKIKGVEGESRRTKHYEADRARLSAAGGTARWKCEGGSGEMTECTCKGILDCKALIDSGQCKGGTVWEGEDPAEGGCDVPSGG